MKREYFKCSCQGEIIQCEICEDNEGEELPYIDVAFFSYGLNYNEKLSLWQKFRWSWHLFRTGKPFSDAVELTTDEAIRMGEWLIEAGKEINKQLEIEK